MIILARDKASVISSFVWVECFNQCLIHQPNSFRYNGKWLTIELMIRQKLLLIELG